MKHIFSLLIILTMFLTSCASWQTVYTGTYQEKTFKYQSWETKGFSTNSIDFRIIYGNYEPVYIDAVNTDFGPPYSTDIYAEKAFIIKNDTLHYINDNIQPNNNYTYSSMLYIPFKNPEDEIGNAYFDLINDNWALFDSLFAGSRQSGIPVILGIVQGNRASFLKEFKGTIKGKKVNLRIENDGRIIYEEDDKSRQGLYAGLSQSVQMPGKIILIKNDGLTLAEIKNLKNEYGTDPTHYFEFRIEEKQ